MRSMPHWPASRAFHIVSTSFPSGVVAPRPVMTTRRSAVLLAIKSNGAAWADISRRCPGKLQRNLFAAQFFDVFDDIAHALELLGFLVGNLMPELLFQCHDQLNGVERVRAQVLDELGIGSHLVGINAQLLDDDFFDSRFGGFFSSHDGSPFLFLCS